MTTIPLPSVAPCAPMPPGTPCTAADVAAAARALEAQGRRILHLEVGEPDFATPAHVVAAAEAAMRDGQTRYAPPAGIPELRAAVAAHVAERGVMAMPEQVVVSPGAKLLIVCTALAALRPGNEVLVPDPGYPAYAEAARLAGARVRHYPLREDGGVDAAAVAARVGPRTRMLVLNSPHNPTGGMLDEGALHALAALAARHDLLVLADEIYARLAFDDAHRSIAALPGMAARTVLVDGFSKAYAMTGWRLAYGVLPPPLVPAVVRLLAATASCAAPFVQRAGVAALAGPQNVVEVRVAELCARRDALVDALNAVEGVHCPRPAGGLYVFPSVAGLLARTGGDEGALARALLEREGVACVPGTGFGRGGAGRLRFALTAPAAVLAAVGEKVRRAAALGSLAP
ncbi:MAG TPA: aminotransferase class I/II-fold pyridoxal phosphate-dependent enzyme [Gemmatimonadaceae bacterium]|nr:aminotransferase class I/II-fold pyridoxal phosphate-dependent enzyme [Gemmatimonadaceae bacterium]